MKNVKVENIFNELNVMMSLSKNIFNKNKDKYIKVKLSFQSFKKTCNHEVKFYCFQDIEKVEFKTFLKHPKVKFRLEDFMPKDIELESDSIDLERALVDYTNINFNFDLHVADCNETKYFCFLTIDDKLAAYNQFEVIKED